MPKKKKKSCDCSSDISLLKCPEARALAPVELLSDQPIKQITGSNCVSVEQAIILIRITKLICQIEVKMDLMALKTLFHFFIIINSLNSVNNYG